MHSASVNILLSYSTLANISGAVVAIFTVESVGATATRQVRQATTQPR